MSTQHGCDCIPAEKEEALTRREFLKLASSAAAGAAVAGAVAGCRPQGDSKKLEAFSTSAPNAPAGISRGIYPGRVVWVHRPEAAHWDGVKGNWWQDQYTDQGMISEMLSQALRQQSGKSDDASAWSALFISFNERRGKTGAGYSPGEKIAIKINLNQVDSHQYFQNGSFNTPQLVYALLKQLVASAGVPAQAIAVYDAIRYIPDAIYNRCKTSELEGVRFVDWSGGDGREKYQRDLNVQMHWSGDVKGNATYLPTAVTQADYLINLAILRGHNLAGVTLCAKNHFGSICNDLKGKPTQQAPQGAGIHHTVAAHGYTFGDPEWTWQTRPMGTYSALVDLMGHPHLGEKTLLFMLDGLYVSQNQTSALGKECRWSSAPFNGHWTSSLLISQDGVAIDSVGTDFLLAEPTVRALPDVLPEGSTPDNYLHESALAGSPPSGISYDPSGKGTRLVSLGVHEHWNNGDKKQYSRNLGKADGIELIRVV